MKTKPPIQPISMCCYAPLLVTYGEEGTNHWTCSQCCKPSDPIHISGMSFTAEWKESNKETIKPPKTLKTKLYELWQRIIKNT